MSLLHGGTSSFGNDQLQLLQERAVLFNTWTLCSTFTAVIEANRYLGYKLSDYVMYVKYKCFTFYAPPCIILLYTYII